MSQFKEPMALPRVNLLDYFNKSFEGSGEDDYSVHTDSLSLATVSIEANNIEKIEIFNRQASCGYSSKDMKESMIFKKKKSVDNCGLSFNPKHLAKTPSLPSSSNNNTNNNESLRALPEKKVAEATSQKLLSQNTNEIKQIQQKSHMHIDVFTPNALKKLD